MKYTRIIDTSIGFVPWKQIDPGEVVLVIGAKHEILRQSAYKASIAYKRKTFISKDCGDGNCEIFCYFDMKYATDYILNDQVRENIDAVNACLDSVKSIYADLRKLKVRLEG